MNLPEDLSARIIGQITLMQSVVFKLPDQKSMLEFVCQGFKDIKGVEKVQFKLAGEPGPVLREAIPSNHRVFSIQNTHQPYAQIFFTLSEPDQFNPYTPFIENFCNMLGVIFDEQNQRELNESLRGELERMVSDRTKELEQEVKEHKRTANDLVQSEIRFREFVENTDSLVTRVDAGGKFVYVNHTSQEILGLSPESCIGLPAFSFVAPKDKDRTQQWFEKCVEQQVDRDTIENCQISRTGGRKEMIWNVSFKYDKNGNLDHANSIGKDISQRRTLEKRLRQAQKMEAIGTLAGGIAHDFNNILSPVLGYTEMLEEDIPKESYLQEYLNQIHIAAIRASELVKQILSFSRQSDQESRPVKIQQIIKEALKLLTASIPTSIRIKTDINEKCGVVIADPTQIHQIIMNLATNAYHAMQRDGGQLTVALDQVDIETKLNPFFELSPGKYALIKIIDTGMGIQKEVQEKVFDPYFTTKPQDKGTGLGLAVVQGIVKACKGEISIYSEPEKGTEIHVYLPVVNQASENDTSHTAIPIPGGNESLLIVDDDPAIIGMEKQILQRLGYKVKALTSSLEALELFRENPNAFDLIISDLTMPGMTGTQLTQRLREIRNDVPVIICTGFSDQISEGTSQQYDIQGFIMKPLVRRELALMIRNAIEKKMGIL